MLSEDSMYELRALNAHIEHHLDQNPMANSIYHTRVLPEKLCKEIATHYSLQGWAVGYTIGKGTTFSFIR